MNENTTGLTKTVAVIARGAENQAAEVAAEVHEGLVDLVAGRVRLELDVDADGDAVVGRLGVRA